MSVNKIIAMAAMLAATSSHLDSRQDSSGSAVYYKESQKWKRKKCKSCKLFPCKKYQNPLSTACYKYEKKK